MSLEKLKQAAVYVFLVLVNIVAPKRIKDIDEHIRRQILILKDDRNAQYDAGVYWAKRSKNNLVMTQYSKGVYIAEQSEEAETGRETKRAIKWFTLASDQGHPRATYELAELYLNGKGTAISKHRILPDPHKGFKLMEKAAYQGEPIAQYKIGMMYREGKIGIKDNDKADQWLIKSSTIDLSTISEHILLELAKIKREKHAENPNKGMMMAAESLERSSKIFKKDSDKSLEEALVKYKGII